MRLKREILADVPNGKIVRFNDRWGVTCITGKQKRGDHRIVDFWDGGREHVPMWKVVEVQT